MRAPSDDVPDGTVLQEFRKGFMIGKTLLRPAMVQVCAAGFEVPDTGLTLVFCPRQGMHLV